MPRFSIVCAIEAGRLEAQTLLMLKTLRRFAGELGSCPAVAFQGRSGQPVSPATVRELARLNVDYVFRPDLNQAPWFNYTNKIAAVQYAQEAFSTPWCLWLDSDILFLHEPSFCNDNALSETDFHARFEYLAPAVSGADDPAAAYWEQICALCGVRFADMGCHDLDLPAKRMKPYFNSGVFLWRADTGFADRYAENFYRILSARIAPEGIGPWFADQVSLTPTIAGLDLEWRMLDARDHLMLFQGAAQDKVFLDVLPQANLVHYSKARTGADSAAFDALVLDRRPGLADMLAEHDGFTAGRRPSLPDRARMLSRRLRQQLYVRRCRAV